MKKHYIKYIIVGVALLFLAAGLLHNQNISVEEILAFTPRNPLKAVIFILVLYAAKSATIIFPLILLEITVGHLFPMWAALGLNFFGVLIVLTVPYWIGRIVGMNTVQRFICKYPRFAEITRRQQCNSLFLCFFCVLSAVCPAMWSLCIWVRLKLPTGKICSPEHWVSCQG